MNSPVVSESNLQRAEELLRSRLRPEQIERAFDPLEGYVEQPVPIRQFLEDPKYLNAPEIWPDVRTDLLELFDPEKHYDHAVFDEGIGSGKSYKSSIITTYLLYTLLCLRNPQAYFNLAPGSIIMLLNMASNAKQAQKVVFNEVKNRVEHCRWFISRGYLPDREIQSELRFPKNLVILPGNSSATFPMGYNLYAGILDEAAWYTDNQVRDLAEDIYDALDRRIRSRFGRQGLLVTISSPRYVDDYIETLMREAEHQPRTLAVRRTTWGARPNWEGPTFDEIHPRTKEVVHVPIELEDAFKRNRDKAWRDYGAVPSLALEPYFKQMDLIAKCIVDSMSHPLDEMGRMLESFRPIMGMIYYMHLDLSLVSDATGIAMAHRDGVTVTLDLIHRIAAQPGKEINLSEITNFVLALKTRGFNLGLVTFDQFQSAQSIQDLNANFIKAERLSVDKDLGPYETLKETAYSGHLRMYHHEWLINEMTRLELIEGKKVNHPAKGSKDVADAVAGAVYNAVHVGTSQAMTVKIL